MDREQLLDTLVTAYLKAVEAGQQPDTDELLARHPDLADELQEFFAAQKSIDQAAALMRGPAPAPVSASEAPTLMPARPAAGEAPTLVPGAAPPKPSLGTVRYFGDYELLEEIARGGMGVVYRARQLSLNRIVALKMILAGELASAVDVARFRTEAEAAANLDHPNILPIFEVGEHQGHQYFSMKLIEGGSLAGTMASGAFGPANKQGQKRAAELVATIAWAVHHAHQRGILHRDLKPGNILLDADGQPQVTDFGLAKRMGAGDLGQTRTGNILGTPSYMPPEQARSEKVLTTGVDIYSLGAILYELLTGRPPFRAESALDIVLQVLEEAPTPPSKLDPRVDRDLETICLKCLEKVPAERYGTAEALADDLRRFQLGEPVLARPVGSFVRGWRWCRRNPVVTALMATVVLCLIGGTAISTYFALSAKAETFLVRRNLYASQMNQACSLWQAAEPGKVRELLDVQRPDRNGGFDFRDFEWHYLQRLLHGERHTLWPPQFDSFSPLLVANRTVLFRPGCSQVAWVKWPQSGGSAQVVLSDAASGQSIRSFPDLWDVNFSPDGRYLGSFSSTNQRKVGGLALSGSLSNLTEGALTVWDAETGNKLASRRFSRVGAFSQDGSTLAAIVRADRVAGPGPDGPKEIRIWQWTTGKDLASLPGIWFELHDVSYSNDGGLLAATGSTGELGKDGLMTRIWDAKTGKELRAFRPQYRSLRLGFSPDGKQLRILLGASIQTWNISDGKKMKETPLEGSILAGMTHAAFSLDGGQAFLGCADKVTRIFDTESGKIVRQFRGDDAAVVCVAVSSDNALMASVAADGSVKLWDTNKDQDARTIIVPGERVQTVAFRPGSDQLAVMADGINMWDVISGKVIEREQATTKKDLTTPSPLAALEYSNDGSRLVSAVHGKGLEWEVTVRDAGRDTNLVLAIRAAKLAFSPDGKWLAASAQVWDLDSGEQVYKEESPVNPFMLVFSPDNSRLLIYEQFSSKDNDGKDKFGMRIRIMQKAAKGWTNAAYLPGLTEQKAIPLAFTPDGKRLLAFGKRVYVWDIAKDRQLQSFSVDGSIPKVSPSGTRLATATKEGWIILWDVASGQPVLKLAGINVLTGLEFNSDGTRLAASGQENGKTIVRIWDATPIKE